MVLKTGVGLLVFVFSHIQMNVVVGMHSRKERTGRKGREGQADVERSKQDGSGD